jgi:hypothetical protein
LLCRDRRDRFERVRPQALAKRCGCLLQAIDAALFALG